MKSISDVKKIFTSLIPQTKKTGSQEELVECEKAQWRNEKLKKEKEIILLAIKKVLLQPYLLDTGQI